MGCFRRLTVLVTLAGLQTSGFAVAAESRRDDRGRGGATGLGAVSLQLVRRADVQKELRMTAEQIQQIEQLATNVQQQVRGRYGSLRSGLSPQQRRDAYARLQEQIRNQREGAGEKLAAILNRRQQARLAELEFRFNMQQGSPVGALASAGVELDEEETAKLRETQRRVQAELRKRIAQLQREANMEILGDVLTRDKIQRLMGDDFSFVGGVPSLRSRRQETPSSVGGDRRPDSTDRGKSRRDRRRRSSRER